MVTSGWLFRSHQSSNRSSSSARPVLEALVYRFRFLVRPMLARAALGILPRPGLSPWEDRPTVWMVRW